MIGPQTAVPAQAEQLPKLKDFDLCDPATEAVLYALLRPLRAADTAAYQHLASLLTTEQTAALHQLLAFRDAHCTLVGAHQVLLKRRKRYNREVYNGDNSLQLQKHISIQNEKINRLEARLARLMAPVALEQAPEPELVEEAATKPWDYPSVNRKPSAQEVVTDVPFNVQTAARQVEEYVRRHGPCLKGDVSSALPTLRRDLPDAYKHLHLSQRVQVKGVRLSLWPTA